nr:hypothetical protein [uncultured Selenomonas sp.]
MGILSGLKQLNDARKERNEEKRIERRAARLEAIEEFIKRDYGVTDFGTVLLLGDLGDKSTGISDLDRTIKASAPYLTTMLEELYLNQKSVAEMHELEGRYVELKERYDELKREHDALIAELAKKAQYTR